MQQIIELNSEKIEVFAKGVGDKVVVIQTGMYCSIYDWMEIIDELSKWTKVIAYHRPGYGESSIESDNRTTMKVANELKGLLEKLEVRDPIILVDSTSVNLHRLNTIPK